MILLKFSVKSECGQTTNQITSYFQNPGWPEASPDRIICTLTLNLQIDAVQVLLNFVTFEVSNSGRTLNNNIYLLKLTCSS